MLRELDHKVKELEEGYRFQVPVYEVEHGKGIKPVSILDVNFVRGSKIDGENVKPKLSGVITEGLLTCCVEYLTYVNTGELRCRETSVAITKLEEALMWLGKRQKDRKKRKVQSTYQK